MLIDVFSLKNRRLSVWLFAFYVQGEGVIQSYGSNAKKTELSTMLNDNKSNSAVVTSPPSSPTTGNDGSDSSSSAELVFALCPSLDSDASSKQFLTHFFVPIAATPVERSMSEFSFMC